MESFSTKEKRSTPTKRNSTSPSHSPMGVTNRAQQNQIRQIIQPKLSIGQPNDKYENEADNVADHVVANKPVPAISSITGSLSSPANQNVQAETAEDEQVQEKQIQREAEEEEEELQTKLIQRQAEEEEEEPVQTKLIQRQSEEEEEEPVQTKLIQRQAEEEEEEPVQTQLLQRLAEEDDEEVQAKGSIPSAQAASKAIKNQPSGSLMRPDVRQVLETGMGADLSKVRVHEDDASHDATASINAKAFTHKNDIWLGAGQSQSDLHLMAHESTHVVQQGAAAQQSSENTTIQRKEDSSDAAAVSPFEKIKALAAAQAAMQQADAKVGKSKEQVAQEKVKKAEEDKEKESADEAKKKAEEELVGEEEALEEPVEEEVAVEGEVGADEKAGDKKGKLADPAYEAVLANVRNESTAQKEHKPAADEADAAQQAAESPASELESKAQSNQVETMETAETPAFDAIGFKAKLMEQIKAMAPKSAKEADDFKGSGKVNELKSGMTSEVETQKGASQAPMQEASAAAPDASGIEPKPVTPLAAPEMGPVPGDVNAKDAVPKTKTETDVEAPIKENTQQIGDKMDENNVTDEQLANSNEPSFNEALAGKKEANTQAVAAPNAYRQFESGNIDAAQQDATVSAAASMAGMQETRAGATTELGASQEKTKSDDELAREKVASDIKVIYDETKVNVDTILTDLDTKVSTAFDEGANAAKAVFEGYVDARMTAYKEDRYGGWLGWAKWVKDKVMSMPSAVNAFYTEGRNRYLKEMDVVIDRVVTIIGGALTDAKAKVAEGKAKIADYVASLPENLKTVGQEAASEIQDKFDTLEQSIDDKQDQLITDLATKYNENLKAVDARIEEMKEANKGLVDKVVDAVVGVIDAIIKIKTMLTTLLSKIAGVIGDIIADPIGFLGNLIKGIKKGFDNFVGNIMTHMISGLVKWLTGALGPVGITIPENLFSLKGIFSLVTQVLGLTWDYFKTKAVKLLGAPVVSALETGFELFIIVKEKGIAGLWGYVKEQFSNLKEMVIDEIKSMIITQVITAGVKWIIGLLNPAGAFIKAAMAIYEIVKFFIERAAQIYEFVNSVVDSVADIVKGNISGAAQKVETALANSIPLIIGFLASLLGISGLAKKVQKVIGKVRKKIDKAIDKLLLKAKKFAKKIYGKGKAAVGKIAEWWKKKKHFKTKTGESHEVYFKGDEKNPVAMVASNNPEPATVKVAKFEKIAKSPEATDKQKAMKGKLAQTKALASKDPNSEQLVSNFKEFFEVFAEGRGLDGRATKVQWGGSKLGDSDIGIRMTAEWLGPDHTQGGPPESSAQKDLMGKLNTDPKTPNESKYIRGHLLNDNLGGPGKDLNLFPITANANKEHHNKIENQVKTWVNVEKRWVYYQVEVKGISSSLASTTVKQNHVNATFSCRAAIKDAAGKEYNGITANITSKYKEVHSAKVETTGEQGSTAPKVSKEAKKMEVLESSAKKDAIYLDELAAAKKISSFTALDYSEDDAKKLISGRPSSGYKQRSQLPSGVSWPDNYMMYRKKA